MNNPIKYTDPSGHCANNDAICKEILEDTQDRFSVKIDDRNGKFTRTTLIAISRGMGTMRAAMGDEKFNGLFAGVTYSVDKPIGNIKVAPNGMGAVGTTDIMVGRDVVNDAPYVEYETAHELSHIWDNKCDGCMSTGFMNSTGGSESGLGTNHYQYSPQGVPPVPSHDTLRWEDWADSVTTYLYPSYPKYIAPKSGQALDWPRYSYVDRVFSGRKNIE